MWARSVCDCEEIEYCSNFMLNILYLYNAGQTYTNAVFEHLDALGRFSGNRAFFMHSDSECPFAVDLSRFDAVCVHFSIRLPYDQLSPAAVKALSEFNGIKFLFIQDEYDNTHRTWHWIKTLGFQLVFTVVPELGISQVYPPHKFGSTRFVSNLTGYVPSALAGEYDSVLPPSLRPVIVGYRGRPLPLRYGELGFEKVEIGRMVKSFCEQNSILSDIAWGEKDRIYGPRWYAFIRSCRSMLGSESGSNVFNWDGQLEVSVAEYRKENPTASDSEVYNSVIRPSEISGIMNQISPRVFEAISARTVLVLFEGEYSGVVKPNEHYIPLKRDGSNIAEVFEKLNDGEFVDQMADRAFRAVIASGRYSYSTFVKMVDWEIARSSEMMRANVQAGFAIKQPNVHTSVEHLGSITTNPTRATQSVEMLFRLSSVQTILRPLARVWAKMPGPVRSIFRPLTNRLKRVVLVAGK
jgi:hypothetical protein